MMKVGYHSRDLEGGGSFPFFPFRGFFLAFFRSSPPGLGFGSSVLVSTSGC